MKQTDPPVEKSRYFRVEAVLEAPGWALVIAVALMSLAILGTVIDKL